ncbi:Hypp9052 [Branchiostoma lanceolatum]|uniref:Hypp9052 protein n=1 Tax=Branchiostoma lanceolatum TaxID=7740 RepID=A0A8J9ZD72_BRALA|nr:Hypp9052 [Branchiostoma lanceolatum]
MKDIEDESNSNTRRNILPKPNNFKRVLLRDNVSENKLLNMRLANIGKEQTKTGAMLENQRISFLKRQESKIFADNKPSSYEFPDLESKPKFMYGARLPSGKHAPSGDRAKLPEIGRTNAKSPREISPRQTAAQLEKRVTFNGPLVHTQKLNLEGSCGKNEKGQLQNRKAVEDPRFGKLEASLVAPKKASLIGLDLSLEGDRVPIQTKRT